MSYMINPMQLNRTEKGNVVVSWTGGKDGCYSCYQVMAEGYQVAYLLHFRNMKKVGSHEINPGIIQAQSEAVGIPLVQRGFLSYEQEFKKAILGLREKGARVDGAVFGHIETHKMLVDRICRDMNLDLILPLWKQDSTKILREIIDSGFEVLVVSVKDGLLGENGWAEELMRIS